MTLYSTWLRHRMWLCTVMWHNSWPEHVTIWLSELLSSSGDTENKPAQGALSIATWCMQLWGAERCDACSCEGKVRQCMQLQGAQWHGTCSDKGLATWFVQQVRSMVMWCVWCVWVQGHSEVGACQHRHVLSSPHIIAIVTIAQHLDEWHLEERCVGGGVDKDVAVKVGQMVLQ